MITRRTLLLGALPPGVSLLAMEVPSGRILDERRAGIAPVPPGSVVKPFTLCALSKRNLNERIPCPTKLRVGRHSLDCVHGPLAAPPDAVEALAYSCNCWFASMISRYRPNLVQSLEGWGFGEIPLSTDPVLLGLGVEGIRTTPLQLAHAYRFLLLTPKGAPDAVFRGLAAAADYGTARLARPADFAVAGKTGTVGTPPGAWFAGYGPLPEPRWIVVVYIWMGVGGAQAAPVAKACFERLYTSAR